MRLKYEPSLEPLHISAKYVSEGCEAMALVCRPPNPTDVEWIQVPADPCETT